MEQHYRILLAEDHIIFRELIKKSLKEIDGLEVVGEVGDGVELLDSLQASTPDMVILDLGMPQMSGIEAAKKIKQDHPDIKLLVLTMYKSKEYLMSALEAGVEGYLVKDNAFTDLVAAIDTVRGGRVYISSLLSQELLNIFAKKSKPESVRAEILSPRELEVMKLFAKGKSNKEIAQTLEINETTVRIHLGNIKKKIEVKSNVDLVKYAIQKGFTSPN